ncbi:MAG: TIGR00730 family Rossman fold protein [Phycisphaerales bacterium]|nr:TIGR00730 family Rossman fold protein [Phycisphaerales bacterium]
MKRNQLMAMPSTDEPWRIFRIMSEFVDGFDAMSGIGPAVSVFGSARTKPDEPAYLQAVELGKKLAENGFPVVTGGGPGIMEAANKGAFEAGGTSVGLNIVLPYEQKPNPYVNIGLHFDYFFARKVMFVKYAVAVVCFPGGFGTLDELFETLTLIQTERTTPSPLVLFGSEFWGPLVEWTQKGLMEKYKTISPEDMNLFKVTDSIDESIEFIVERYPKAGLLWEQPRRFFKRNP